MIKAVLILGLAAIASAQVLRISPAVIGSSSAGQLQVIQLANGGGLSPYRVQNVRAQPVQVRPVQVRPIQVQPVRVVQAQPIQYVAAPQPQAQIIRVVAAPQRAAPIQYAPVRASAAEDSAPAPYAFAFDSEDEYGTKLGRQESADGSGKVTGQYTLSDANGISRVVVYIADDQGFRAEVKTNEPGTLTSEPADVKIQSSAGQ